MLEKWVARKNKYKVVQAIFEITVCAAAVVWVVLSIRSYNLKQNQETALPPESESAMIPCGEVVSGYTSAGRASGTHFIAISYNGIVKQPVVDGKIVNLEAFMEQMQALKASAGLIRYQIGQKMTIRTLPELNFALDESIEYGSYMAERIAQVMAEDKQKEAPEDDADGTL